MDEYQKAEKEASKNQTGINFYNEKWICMASDRMYAFLYPENSDPKKYSTPFELYRVTYTNCEGLISSSLCQIV